MNTIAPSPFQYQEKLDGCVFDNHGDAVRQLIESSAGTLRLLLEEPDKRYAASFERLREMENEIMDAMSTLKTAFKTPDKLIHVYKLQHSL
jgi:hypothetical protein